MTESYSVIKKKQNFTVCGNKNEPSEIISQSKTNIISLISGI